MMHTQDQNRIVLYALVGRIRNSAEVSDMNSSLLWQSIGIAHIRFDIAMDKTVLVA